MKKILLFITTIFICGVSIAQTIRWHIGNEIIQTNCNAGESITPPPAPDRFGYHLKEWEVLYTPIEYLESTGTQYIDTGVVPDFKSTAIKTSITFLGNIGIQYGIFGTGSSSDSSRFWLVSEENGSNWEAGIGPHYNKLNKIQNKTTFIQYTPRNNIEYIIKIDNEEFIADIDGYGNNLSNIYVFTVGRTDSHIPRKSIIKLYYFQIYDNDVLLRDFIPVLDGNGTPCMYDKVERKFYYNAGTGQFIAGPVIGE